MGDDEPLSRAQRRLLRRIYNGRTVPIVADGQAFASYRAATDHLLSLGVAEREAVYAQMKDFAKQADDPAQ